MFGVYPYITLVHYNPITSCVFVILKNKTQKKTNKLGILEDKESEFVCPHVRVNKWQNSTKTK